MDSSGTVPGNQGWRSKRVTSVPIRYIMDLGFTDEKTENNADANRMKKNSDWGHNPSNNGDSSSDKSMGLGRN